MATLTTARYLETIIDFAYVLLRMLERYSKTKAFMFVRKRKAARRKRKAGAGTQGPGPTAEEYAGDDDEGEDGGAEKDTPSYAEHTFTFQEFEKVCSMIVHRARLTDLALRQRGRCQHPSVVSGTVLDIRRPGSNETGCIPHAPAGSQDTG